MSQWETTTYEGCTSDAPNDCQALCYRTYPAVYDTIFEPVRDSVGSPFYQEIAWKTLEERGSLSSYNETDCSLTDYQVITPCPFGDAGVVTRDGVRTIRKEIIRMLEDKPGQRLQFQFRYGGETLAAGTFDLYWRVLSIIE